MWDNEVSTRNCYHCKTQEDGTVACDVLGYLIPLRDNRLKILTIERILKRNWIYEQCRICSHSDCEW